MEYTIRIGGEAGQGLQLISGFLAKFLVRRGYEVFTHQDYMSRIRGGHNYYQIRFSDQPVTASRDLVRDFIAGMTGDYFLAQAAILGCRVPIKISGPLAALE